jgi:exportin-5
MYQHIQDIIQQQDLLSSLEKITLTESAIIISNEFKNYEKQSAFLAEVLKPSKDIWLSKEIQELVSN